MEAVQREAMHCKNYVHWYVTYGLAGLAIFQLWLCYCGHICISLLAGCDWCRQAADTMRWTGTEAWWSTTGFHRCGISRLPAASSHIPRWRHENCAGLITNLQYDWQMHNMCWKVYSKKLTKKNRIWSCSSWWRHCSRKCGEVLS